MKIVIYGIEDFTIGKKLVADERLDKLKELIHSPKIIYSQIEFVDETHLKNAQAVTCLETRKDELIVMDLEYIEQRLIKATDEEEKELLSFCQEQLNKESLLNECNFTDEQIQILNSLAFITTRPIVLVPENEIKDSAGIIRRAFDFCGMISFFTVNEKELKSWPIKKGTVACDAAGCIHSDIQRGFIKAEVIAYEDILKSGGINQAKSQGLMRLEDKDYVVKDADLIKFRFNV